MVDSLGSFSEDTVPCVIELDVYDHGLSTTWLDIEGDGDGEEGGRLLTIDFDCRFCIGKLVSAEVSLGQVGKAVSYLLYCFDGRLLIGTGDSAGQVMGGALGNGGRATSCLLECWGWR